MLMAADVANWARNYHPSLSSTNAPQQLAYSALSRFQTAITEDITRRVPGYFAQRFSVVFDASTFVSGIDLSTLVPAGVKDFIDARFLYNQTDPAQYTTGLFVPYEQRDMPHSVPAYTLAGNTLYLLGCTDANQLASAYSNYSGLTLSVTPIPSDITKDTDTFPGYPDDVRECLAALLAAFWLRRMVSNPAYNVDRTDADYFDSIAAQERTRFLGRIFQITARQSYYIRAVR